MQHPARKTRAHPAASLSPQLTLIFKTCGAPTPDVWPAFDRLPQASLVVRDRPEYRNRIREIFGRHSEPTKDLMSRLLALDPLRRRARCARLALLRGGVL